jgi:hypothetical protein
MLDVSTRFQQSEAFEAVVVVFRMLISRAGRSGSFRYSR